VQRASQGDPEPILQEGTRIDLLRPSNTASSEEETIILTQGDLLGNTENSKEETTTVEQADPAVSFGTAAPGVSRRMPTMSETERLCDARSADDEKLSRLFPPDRYATYEMGDIDDFVGGLGAMVGPPNPDLMTTMTDEHTMRYDSSAEFLNAPYWIRTTSEIEWFFVTDPEGGLAKLLREANDHEVWLLVTPQEVADALPRLERRIGRRRAPFWSFLIGKWREQGYVR